MRSIDWAQAKCTRSRSAIKPALYCSFAKEFRREERPVVRVILGNLAWRLQSGTLHLQSILDPDIFISQSRPMPVGTVQPGAGLAEFRRR